MQSPPRPVLDLIERLINGYLAQDEWTLRELAALDGRVIRVALEGPELAVDIAPHADGVSLLGLHEMAPDASLTGPVSAYLSALRQPDQTTLAGLRSEGDVMLLGRIQQILKNARIDWEGLLARALGDLPAHQVGRTGQAVAEWLNDARQSLQENLRAYLTDESGIAVSQGETDELRADGERLRNDVARLEARIERIERLLTDRPGTEPAGPEGH